MQINRIRDALSAIADIRVAYVFGSVAKGTERADSDVDVGVLTASDLSLADRGRLQDRLSAALGRRVDLVDLRAAPPLLRHEVVRDGVCVVTRDEDERVSFEHRTAMEFLDTRHLRAVQHAYLRERAAGTRVA